MRFPFIVIHLEVFVTFLPPPHYSVCIELKASWIRSSSEWHFVFLLKHIITSGLLKYPMPWWGRRLALCFWGHLFQHGIVLPASSWTHLEADGTTRRGFGLLQACPEKQPFILGFLDIHMYVHLSAPYIQLIFPPGEGTESELALSSPLAPCLLFLIFLSDKEWISFLLETILMY